MQFPLSIPDALRETARLDGFLGAAIVDLETGFSLGALGSDRFDVELAAASSRDLVRTKLRLRSALGAAEDAEAILVTLPDQYHLFHVARHRAGTFAYLALDRAAGDVDTASRCLAALDAPGPARS